MMLITRETATLFTKACQDEYFLQPKPAVVTPSSVVCFAQEASTLQNVVLKKVTNRNLADSEIAALKELSHVRVTKLLNSFPDSQSVTVIYYSNPKTLVFPQYSPLNWQKIDLIRIQQILKELAGILDNVHSSGWVHLDLSPNNIMVDRNGCLILIDFALAKKIGQEHQIGCGTPGFIAPEVYESVSTTTASDIYSLGVFFGEMMEIFMPGISLQYLGSSLVRPQTTDFICKMILEVQESCKDDCVWAPIIYQAADLLFKMIVTEPLERITAAEILNHPFLNVDNDEAFSGYTYTSHVQGMLLRPISAMKSPKADPLVLYRYS
jgi:serine/threonine protein kinase